MTVPLLAAAPAARPAPVQGGNTDGGASFGAALQDVLGPAGGAGCHGQGKNASDDGDSTTGALPDLPSGAAGIVPALAVPGEVQALVPVSGNTAPPAGTLAAASSAVRSAAVSGIGLPAAGSAAGTAIGEASGSATEAATSLAPEAARMPRLTAPNGVASPAFAGTAAPSMSRSSAQAQPAQAQPGQVPQPADVDSAGTAAPGTQASGSRAAEPPASNRPVNAHVPRQPTEPAQPQPTHPGQGQVAVPPPVHLPTAVPTAGPTAQPAAPFNLPTTATTFAPGTLAPQLAGPLFSLAAAGPGEHVMTLKVTPEDLGPVTVRAHIDGAGVRIELFAPGDAGRDALRTILPELRRSLTESGLTGSGLGASLDLSDHGAPPGWDTNGNGGHTGTREHTPPQPTGPAPAVAAAAVRARTAVVIPRDGTGSLDILA